MSQTKAIFVKKSIVLAVNFSIFSMYDDTLRNQCPCTNKVFNCTSLGFILNAFLISTYLDVVHHSTYLDIFVDDDVVISLLEFVVIRFSLYVMHIWQKV